MTELPLFSWSESDRDAGDGKGARDEAHVYQVSELNRDVSVALQTHWGDVRVEGEVTNAKLAQSGHLFFTLKDEQVDASIRVTMFRSALERSKVKPRNGERVRLDGTVQLYSPQGAYQLVARAAESAGQGDLAAAFRRIHERLAAEGLMDPARKRELPLLPRTVGVVTSATGAALQDVIRVAHARAGVRILVADCRVQGDAAPTSIVDAIQRIAAQPYVDVVIVTRGGGSAEDLWAFNDERVARAIAACPIPVVCGIGHEIDTTIAELVADVRAATPSNAAELAVPTSDELLQEIDYLTQSLERGVTRFIQDRRNRVLLEQRAVSHHDPRNALIRRRRELEALTRELVVLSQRSLREHQRNAERLRDRLLHAGTQLTQSRRSDIAAFAGRLDAMSPLRVLERGYAIVQHATTARAVVDAASVKPGDQILVRVARGTFEAIVGTRS